MTYLLLALYGVLACTLLIPLLIIGAGLISGPVTVIRAFRDICIEARQLERQKKVPTSRHAQPAYKMYVFERGWYVTACFIGHVFVYSRRFSNAWVGYAATVYYMPTISLWVVKWFVQYVTWLIIVGLHVAARIQYLPAIVCAIFFLALHTLFLCVWLIVSLTCLGILTIIRFCDRKIHRSCIRCSHCYKEMPAAIYLCPTCGAEHPKLWPGVSGILAHHCKACETRLPALDLFGRWRLGRLCSYCHSPFCSGVGEGGSIHLALVGGSAVGKTTYITMAMRELEKLYTKHDYKIALPDAVQEQSFASNLRQLKSGQPLPATNDITPQACILTIQPPHARLHKNVYIYDPAGEVFSASENTYRQEYYQYTNAIILIIDPFAIPAFYYKCWSGNRQIHPAERSNNLDIVQGYERMVSAFETFLGLTNRQRYALPVAVVVTKVDTLQITSEIGMPAVHALMRRDPSIITEEDALHELVREFLCVHELDNLVRDIESHFTHVRYFSCSALGRTPAPNKTGEFVPTGVLGPLVWLLAHTKGLAQI